MADRDGKKYFIFQRKIPLDMKELGYYQVGMLHHILISFQIVNIALFLFFSIFHITSSYSTTITLLSFLSFFIFYILYRLNQIRLSLHAASLALVAIPAVILFFGKGIHDISIILYPMFFVILTLLHRGIFYSVYAFLAISSFLLIGILEYKGFLNLSEPIYSPRIQDIILSTVFLLIAAIANRYTFRSFIRLQNEKEKKDQIYQEIFDGVEDGVLIFDAKTGIMLDANQASMKIYNRGKKELLESSIQELSSGESPYSMKDAKVWIRKCFHEGPQHLLWRARKGDGTLFWAEVTLKYLLIQGEKRIIVLVRDIDKLQSLETQLHQSEKLYSLGQMAGGIAHDFNNQLMGIQGFTELLHYELPEETRKQYLQMIEKSVKRASDLTSNLLSFARKGKKTNKPVEILSLVAETVEFIKRGIDQRIDIQMELPREELYVTGDASLLENALLNLGLNGRDAIAGTGRIVFSVEKTRLSAKEIKKSFSEYTDLLPGAFVKISVRDSGSGIESTIQHQVFDPFFTTKEYNKGTGLGLSAVYGAIRQHKGVIYFESALGEGTCFTILLPRHRQG